ncbi:MAG: N-6 DNA methylase [Gallionellaceae bacterium]|nr:N-6 DNA methylase [Gallionellaceae bacterium]
MGNLQQWWNHLGAENSLPVEGLVQVHGYKRDGRPPEEVVMMEKARLYGATAVFFEAARNEKPSVAQAFIYITDTPEDNPAFAETHQKLWSWGGVPLVYRKLPGCVQLFRCAHGPDFVSKTGEPKCNPVKTLQLASAVSADPWWNIEQLRNGTLWDNTQACNMLLSAEKSAHRRLIKEVKQLSDDLTKEGILLKPLRRKLLILSLLIAYLEQREVFKDGYLGRFLPGANEFFEVLANGEALVNLLEALEKRFNGNVFCLSEIDRDRLRGSKQLGRFSKLVEGRESAGGQLSLWKLYSFKDLPVELISHIYELFVKDADSSVYTPPFLVRLMLEETLSWKRLDRLQQRGEIILDPSCGSGIFLVEAYKRLVLHWRSQNRWEKPSVDVLKGLLQQVHGIDREEGAVELAAFSLCLALCDALEPEAIRKSIKLFPPLAGKTLHHSCFFEAKEQGLIKRPIGVVVGNPPFVSRLTTVGAERSYARYNSTHGLLPPDKQLAYLFLHESMEMVAEGGVLSMLQQYNFLYNQQSLEFRRSFIAKWDVREVLDFISVRGLFRADTKVIVVVVEAATPPVDRKILHATFRRSGRVNAELGFDIDYYDLHWLPRNLVLANDAVWRTDLLGGGRVLGFVDRLKEFQTLGEYAKKQEWNFGEGFIEAIPKSDPTGNKMRKLSPAKHLTGKPLLPTNALTESGIDHTAITVVKTKLFKSQYTDKRFTAPMTLVHQQFNLNHAYLQKGYLTYKNQIVGFCGEPQQQADIRAVSEFIQSQKRTLQAFVAATSVKSFTQHATTLSAKDIISLPFSESGTLDISQNEKVLVDDMVDYYRDLIRLGEDSAVMIESGHAKLSDFTSVFSTQINTVYKKNPLRALEPQSWSGVMCQPFVFGKGEVDWSGAEALKGKLDKLLHEQQGDTLQVTRICRIYDGNFVFLLKPDRLRYWLRSVALRDADEMLSDLRAQGF